MTMHSYYCTNAFIPNLSFLADTCYRPRGSHPS